MGSSVNKIPSISIPLTDGRGRINRVWHEFFREFIAGAIEEGEDGAGVLAENIVAGPGLIINVDEDAPDDVIFAVGAGAGITVNANDVNVDISSQAAVTPALDDELMLSDMSDNNNIRKTKVRELVKLAGVGGDDTQIQYNANGILGGDSGFATNGAGVLAIVGTLSVDSINFDGNTITTLGSNQDLILDPQGTGDVDVNTRIRVADINNDMIIEGANFSTVSSSDTFSFTVPEGSGVPEYIFTQSDGGGGGSSLEFFISGLKSTVNLVLRNDANNTSNALSESYIQFANSISSAGWTIGMKSSGNSFNFTVGTTSLNTGNVFTLASSDGKFTHHTRVVLEEFLVEGVTAGITASTTQTQGQGALTKRINEISTVANVNDTVTLPTAVAGIEVIVINNGANTLKIFPASGDNLGAGVDTSTTLAAGSNVTYVAYNTTNWEVT